MDNKVRELNLKLAKWAGLTQVNIFDVPNTYAEYGFMHFLTHDNKIAMDKLFTESLDSCFKWLIPKLKQTHAFILRNYVNTSTYEIETVGAMVGYTTQRALGDNPALTICLAINKLIDSEAKSNDR